MNYLYDNFTNIFNNTTSTAPYTHTFGAPRWPKGLFRCMKMQGYKGTNTKDMTFTWSEHAF